LHAPVREPHGVLAQKLRWWEQLARWSRTFSLVLPLWSWGRTVLHVFFLFPDQHTDEPGHGWAKRWAIRRVLGLRCSAWLLRESNHVVETLRSPLCEQRGQQVRGQQCSTPTLQGRTTERHRMLRLQRPNVLRVLSQLSSMPPRAGKIIHSRSTLLCASHRPTPLPPPAGVHPCLEICTWSTTLHSQHFTLHLFFLGTLECGQNGVAFNCLASVASL
jgi:hypothetical protein